MLFKIRTKITLSIILSCPIFLLPKVCFSQYFAPPDNYYNSLNLNRMLPPPPTAAALGKYGDIDIGPYTGIPNISIPIYKIQYKDLSLPISLNYQADGVKVEQIASWCGLGWSLNAGGVITRTVRGLPDERYFGQYPTFINNIQNATATSNPTKTDLENQVAKGLEDLEPDIFYFNFGGFSGKFFIGEDGKTVQLIPYQNFQVSYIQDANNDFTSWTITTDNGTKYVFGTTIDKSRTAIEVSKSTVFAYDGSNNLNSADAQAITYNSSWCLVQIISGNSNEIDLNYSPTSYTFRTQIQETLQVGIYSEYSSTYQCPQYIKTKTYTKNEISGYALNLITFGNRKIVFNSGGCRYDLPGDIKLGQISLYNDAASSIPLKSFSFSYSYFFPSTFPAPQIACSSSGPDDSYFSMYRLRLDKIQEVGQNGLSNPPYSFTYNPIQLPPRYSTISTPIDYTPFGIDHWGYYNGQLQNKDGVGNPTLIPTVNDNFNTVTSPYYYTVPGANRSVDATSAQACILTQITYPTGGSTSFN